MPSTARFKTPAAACAAVAHADLSACQIVAEPAPQPGPAPAPLVAPTELTLETRTAFRGHALEHVEASRRAWLGTVDIDLTDTTTIDASGLGILVLVCKRARDRNMSTRLVGAPETVRRLMALTKLDYLFEFKG